MCEAWRGAKRRQGRADLFQRGVAAGGLRHRRIASLVACEGLLLGLLGGALGVVSAFLFLHWQSFTLGNEGLTLAITPGPAVLLKGLLVALVLGLAASLYPAWRASRQPLVEALNTA